MIRTEIERVYEEFRVEFRRYALKHLGNDENLADEAMQETLVRAWSKQGEFVFTHGRQGLYAWLLSILNYVCNHLRRVNWRECNGYEKDIEGLEESMDLADKRASDYDGVLDAMETDEIREAMAEVIAETNLTNFEWAIVTATRLGFSNAQIAKEMGMGTNLVRAHVKNSLPKLRATMHTRTTQGCRSGFENRCLA